MEVKNFYYRLLEPIGNMRHFSDFKSVNSSFENIRLYSRKAVSKFIDFIYSSNDGLLPKYEFPIVCEFVYLLKGVIKNKDFNVEASDYFIEALKFKNVSFFVNASLDTQLILSKDWVYPYFAMTEIDKCIASINSRSYEVYIGSLPAESIRYYKDTLFCIETLCDQAKKSLDLSSDVYLDKDYWFSYIDSQYFVAKSALEVVTGKLQLTPYIINRFSVNESSGV
jgi:hypothetical protein